MHGEMMLIEKLEAENAELRQHCAELRQNMNRTDLQVQQLVELVEFYKEKFKKAEALIDISQFEYLDAKDLDALRQDQMSEQNFIKAQRAQEEEAIELQQRYQPELEYHRDLGRCGI